MAEIAASNHVQVNIVLEESSPHTTDKQTLRMVGLVIINDVHMTLCNLRTQITKQLDSEQLQIISINFKFLKQNFPLSSKQEASMQIHAICINPNDKINLSNDILIQNQETNTYTIMVRAYHSVFTSFDTHEAGIISSNDTTNGQNTNCETPGFISSYPTPYNRIKANASRSKPVVHVSTEVDSILQNAMITSAEYISVDDEEGSVDETTALSPILSGKACITAACFKSPGPPHTFSLLTQRVNTQRSDNDIPCKFTVFGTILNKDNDNEREPQENGNIIWEFDKAKDLIKGLNGVHHNGTNPLWIDIVCDGNTFINIAEHIEPSIHTLTIEDCITVDCREKLEIFKEYLFICLKTWKRGYIQSAIHNINILIFRSMIITYHLGDDITNNVISDARLILKKKFGNICRSPAWVGHTIIDNMIDKMMPEVESRVREVETCEQLVFKVCNESQTELLHRMQNVRSWLVLYRSSLWPKLTITQNLLNNVEWRKSFLCDVPLPYWRDINDHVARMVDILKLGTHTLDSVQNMFVAKISLEMTVLTQQSNALATQHQSNQSCCVVL